MTKPRRVGRRQDPAGRRERIAGDTTGIPGTVHAFVVLDRHGRLERDRTSHQLWYATLTPGFPHTCGALNDQVGLWFDRAESVRGGAGVRSADDVRKPRPAHAA